MRRVIAIGETVYDILFRNKVPFGSKPGGAILNTSVSLARLNIPVIFISSISSDEIGDTISGFLSQNGVNIQYVNRNKSLTRLALAFLDENNNARYVFYRVPPAEPESLSYCIPQKDDIILFGSFYGFDENIRLSLVKFLNEAVHSGSIILYDPNFRKNHIRLIDKVLPFIHENFRLAHVIKTSDEDIVNIFGNNFNLCSGLIQTYHEKIWIITRGCGPVSVFVNGIEYRYEVPEVQTISTVGAGDNFNAGLIYSLIVNNLFCDLTHNGHPEQIRNVIETAVAFGSHVCTHADNYISDNFAEKYAL